MSAPTTSALAAHLVTTANALPEQAELLARIVAERMRWAGDGSAPTVLDVNGQPALDASGVPVTPAALLASFGREMPSFFKPPASRMQTQTATSRAVTGKTAQAAAEHAAEQVRKSTGAPVNPYAAATRNLTLQVMMESNNPALAAEMKATAGVR